MPFDALAHHGITGLAFCRRQSHCGIHERHQSHSSVARVIT